jgi:GSH-dependent disulfide-bond oxidoreductase
MLKFYFHPTPNPMKVALLLEELGREYELIGIDTFEGKQHTAEFRAINPNGKVPAIDDSGTVVFDSHAILLYLAETADRFIPANPPSKAKALSWLMFIATGLSPFSGQAVHFLHHAPESLPYAKNRYLKEVERHYSVLNDHLAHSPYLAGNEYSIADIALWGWANFAGYILGESGLTNYTHVKRLVDEISARPAAARALALREKLVFKTEFDEETKRALFPQNS